MSSNSAFRAVAEGKHAAESLAGLQNCGSKSHHANSIAFLFLTFANDSSSHCYLWLRPRCHRPEGLRESSFACLRFRMTLLTPCSKNFLRDHVKTKEGIIVVDVGAHTPDAVDYPDIAALVCKQVLSTPGSAGIVLCGSGIGISIACNKINGIRCALCHDYYSAEMCADLVHPLY
jgi:hypothetical protein